MTTIFNKHPDELTTLEVSKLQRLAQHEVRVNKRLTDENNELRRNHFERFGDGECWFWVGNGEDRLTTLVCPVLISPEELLDLLPQNHPEKFRDKE